MNKPLLRQILMGLTVVLFLGVLVYANQQTVDKGPESELGKKEAAAKAAEQGRPPLPVGAKAPNFILPDLKQNDVSLQSFREKKLVLLEFFATWCPHCQHSVLPLSAFSNEHKERVAVLAINAGDRPPQRSTSQAFIDQYGATYTILEEPSDQLLDEYHLYGFPLMYLIDRQGKIIWTHQGTLMPDAIKTLEEKVKSAS